MLPCVPFALRAMRYLMRKRTFGLLLLLLLALILITFLIVYHNSFRIALSESGLNENDIQYIHTGIDDNGSEYRVVFQYMPDRMVKILLLTKNNIGLWHVTDEVFGPNSDTEYITMGWMRFASIRRYDVEDRTRFDSEVHKVYAGRNAKKQIEIPLDLLPPNVSANVFQAGDVYVIHFVSYGEMDTLNTIDVMDLLR